jgi:hypothetical protein
MELDGVVQNGLIVPQGECSLPEGTKVRITTEPPGTPAPPTLGERMRQFAEECERQPTDLPTDYAINHDHYLYGTPKKA